VWQKSYFARSWKFAFVDTAKQMFIFKSSMKWCQSKLLYWQVSWAWCKVSVKFLIGQAAYSINRCLIKFTTVLRNNLSGSTFSFDSSPSSSMFSTTFWLHSSHFWLFDVSSPGSSVDVLLSMSVDLPSSGSNSRPTQPVCLSQVH